jgi:hypothetical protein
MKRLEVKALNKELYHHDGVRDSAITYINGYIYEDSNHSKCIAQYLNDKEDENFDIDDCFKRKEFMDGMNDEQLGFAHKKGLEIFIEPFSLQAIDIQTVANEIKKVYPDCKIYEDAPYTNNHYELLAKLNKIVRLKKLIK